jgi:hypothetical protein
MPKSEKNVSTCSFAKTLLGVVDFSYQHYALGDLLTYQIESATVAIDQNLDRVDVIVMVHPGLPSTDFQHFITPENYVTHLDGVAPVFTCHPKLGSLLFIRDAETLNHTIFSYLQGGAAMWPTFDAHIRMRQDFPSGHARLNAFHARYGYLPQLCAPRHYENWARRFHEVELGGRPLVIINPRQSSLTQHPAALFRDARLETWYQFIDIVAARRSDVLFVMVGGYQEWEYRLLHRPNVFVPRTVGLGLAHELAIMKIADLFMGSASGFATFATFSDMAYAIVKLEHRFAVHAELSIGDRRYPFAGENQLLTWHEETTDELLTLFEDIFGRVEMTRAKKSGPPQHSARDSSTMMS